jgi:MYXO-CTERM domain-containing protein
MKNVMSAALLMALTGGAAMAQTQILTDGASRYAYGNTQDGVNGNADLNPTANATGNDWLSHNQFFYRVGTGANANANGIRTIGALGTRTFTQVSSNVGRYDYTSLGTAGGGLFNASITTTLTNNGGGAVNILSRIVLTNTSLVNPLTINFYNLVSPQVSSIANDDSLDQVGGSTTNFRATEAGTSNFIDINGFNNSRFQLGVNRTTTPAGSDRIPALFFQNSGSGGSTNLNLSNVDAIPGTSLFGSSAAMQWSFVIPAGSGVEFYSAIGINQAAVPAPTAMGMLALGGLAAARRRRSVR